MTGEQRANGLGYVCEHLPDIGAQLEYHDDSGPLDRLLAALREGEDASELLDALHEALQSGGDALGVYGNVRGGMRKTLGDFGTDGPGETIYLCPRRQCARYAWPGRGSAGPATCSVDGIPMLLERL
ncbi:hypothetical protein [Streptomyces mirabilis]|uniref:hypothetical protein n=1 Tax=Streptomyces mirabilis TaxID=68239 RepID=UPI00365DE3A9